jgi:hypothetical protein
VALVLGAMSVVPVYLAARGLGMVRWAAFLATALALAVPWEVWLTAATVPEAFTGALLAAGILGVGQDRGRPWFALALLVAALSRYEAWPVCAVFAAVCAGRALAPRRRPGPRPPAGTGIIAALIAAAGPLLWMAWNAYAHGSATHFVTRVVNYRHAIGAADVPLADKLLGYPRALLEATYGVWLLALAGLLGLKDAQVRRRWVLPGVTAGLLLAFLVYGDVRDGAPTHHPERALMAFPWVLAAFGVDGVRTVATQIAWGRPKRESYMVGFLAAALLAWGIGVVSAWDEFPGNGESERRTLQVERGAELRAEGAAHLEVTPCAYEHFALLAAFGAPERATTTKARPPREAASCPEVRVVP